MSNLRMNNQRATVAVVMLYVIAAINLIFLISGFMQYALLNSVANGIAIGMEEAMANDAREQIIGYISMVAIGVCAVTFIMWFRRAYYNLRQEVRSEYGDGWAVGGWFVPILSWFVPYRIMNELWEKTDRLLGIKYDGYVAKNSNSLVVVWWVGWIALNFIAAGISIYSRSAGSVVDFLFLTSMQLVYRLALLIMAVVAAVMVQKYSKMEKQLFAVCQQSGNEDTPHAADVPVEPEEKSEETATF